MRRGDSHEKPAVKPVIAGPYRPKTSIGVEFHGARLARLGRRYSPFSDLDMGVQQPFNKLVTMCLLMQRPERRWHVLALQHGVRVVPTGMWVR